MAEGHVMKEVAHELGVSEQTIKNHLSAVYHKLEVHNLIGAFKALGWLRPNGVAMIEAMALLARLKKEARELIEIIEEAENGAA